MCDSVLVVILLVVVDTVVDAVVDAVVDRAVVADTDVEVDTGYAELSAETKLV